MVMISILIELKCCSPEIQVHFNKDSGKSVLKGYEYL